VVLREDDRGIIAIGQASHAWLSGQLARAWGNEEFGPLDPREEVCLAAEQHDVGMAAWDLRPTLNPATGRPHSFIEMPLETHLELWTHGPRRLITQSRYAAMLVSMHGRRLYELRDLEKMAPADADAVRAFIADQNALQESLLRTLDTDRELVGRNSDLIWTWDYMSLALCLDWAPCAAKSVPTASGPVDIAIERHGHALTFDPWPFTDPRTVTVRCEGRRLEQRAETEAELDAALATARWETVAFRLESRRGD
jgi:uncharacterized protein DUF3891